MTRRRRHLEVLFPALQNDGYETHSAQTPQYNCIAYAAGDTENFWSPGAYWPPGAIEDDEFDFLVQAYEVVGFQVCGDASPEIGFEKVALYGMPWRNTVIWTHAARLRPDGWWESKLGRLEDILHRTPDALTGVGSEYGAVRAYMRRPLLERIRQRYVRRNAP